MDRSIALVLALELACVADKSGAAADSASTTSSSSGGAGESTTGDPYQGQCDHNPTVIADAQQIGITGVSANELLAELEGIYTGTIAWSAATPAHYTGSIEPSALTLEIRYDGGEIRNIDAVQVVPCGHNGPCPCDDSFEIDVTWRLASADGVLDETWTAPIVHEPNSLYMGELLGISHDFQPEQTDGTLDATSFALDDDAVLHRLVAHADLAAGGAQGSIATEIEMFGGVGYGDVAGFAAVREVVDDACNAIDGEPACSWAGCTPVTGRPVSGTPPSCGCNPPQPFCFAAPLMGDPVTTLYVRAVSESAEAVEQVVVFPTLVDPPPSPWRSCADAPELPQCACVDPCG